MVGFMKDGAGKQTFAFVFVQITVTIVGFEFHTVRTYDITALTWEGQTAFHTALFTGILENHGIDEFDRTFAEKTGFVKAMWCGELACEEEIKEKFGVTSRCIPFEQEEIAQTCVCCGKPAKKMVYWGKSY
jgi:prolyl-tRNA synthetase